MGWLAKALNSTIGMKLLVALTGVALMAFLVVHLLGNLLVFVGADAFNTYAKTLKSMHLLLWVARGGLLLTVVVHITLAIRLTARNNEARPVAYKSKQWAAATPASRAMIVSGLLVLAFIIYHLLHFTLGAVQPEFFEEHDAAGRHNAYYMLVKGFQNPLISASYLVAMALLGAHLWHGASSVFQTFGLNHRKYNPAFRAIGPVFAAALVAGFASIPLAVLAGIVKLP